ncbi:MAG: DUF427 domain-containing protein [Isosphaeraceae bacterium]
MSLTIREKTTGAVLAEADPAGEGMIRYEGNLYFAPEAVRPELLKVTTRTYTCPYKGTCFWVDFVGPDGQTARDVAWVYENPKAGHEAIKGRYGFYAGNRGATRQEG